MLSVTFQQRARFAGSGSWTRLIVYATAAGLAHLVRRGQPHSLPQTQRGHDHLWAHQRRGVRPRRQTRRQSARAAGCDESVKIGRPRPAIPQDVSRRRPQPTLQYELSRVQRPSVRGTSSFDVDGPPGVSEPGSVGVLHGIEHLGAELELIFLVRAALVVLQNGRSSQ